MNRKQLLMTIRFYGHQDEIENCVNRPEIFAEFPEIKAAYDAFQEAGGHLCDVIDELRKNELPQTYEEFCKLQQEVIDLENEERIKASAWFNAK
jgi:hypothetical protein